LAKEAVRLLRAASDFPLRVYVQCSAGRMAPKHEIRGMEGQTVYAWQEIPRPEKFLPELWRAPPMPSIPRTRTPEQPEVDVPNKRWPSCLTRSFRPGCILRLGLSVPRITIPGERHAVSRRGTRVAVVDKDNVVRFCANQHWTRLRPQLLEILGGSRGQRIGSLSTHSDSLEEGQKVHVGHGRTRELLAREGIAFSLVRDQGLASSSETRARRGKPRLYGNSVLALCALGLCVSLHTRLQP